MLLQNVAMCIHPGPDITHFEDDGLAVLHLNDRPFAERGAVHAEEFLTPPFGIAKRVRHRAQRAQRLGDFERIDRALTVGSWIRPTISTAGDLDALARLTKSLLSIDTFAFPTRQTRRFFEEIEKCRLRHVLQRNFETHRLLTL